MKFENGNVRKWVLIVYLGLAVLLVVACLAFAAFQVPVEDSSLERPFLVWAAVGALLVNLKASGEDVKAENVAVQGDDVTVKEK